MPDRTIFCKKRNELWFWMFGKFTTKRARIKSMLLTSRQFFRSFRFAYLILTMIFICLTSFHKQFDWLSRLWIAMWPKQKYRNIYRYDSNNSGSKVLLTNRWSQYLDPNGEGIVKYLEVLPVIAKRLQTKETTEQLLVTVNIRWTHCFEEFVCGAFLSLVV